MWHLQMCPTHSCPEISASTQPTIWTHLKYFLTFGVCFGVFLYGILSTFHWAKRFPLFLKCAIKTDKEEWSSFANSAPKKPYDLKEVSYALYFCSDQFFLEHFALIFQIYELVGCWILFYFKCDSWGHDEESKLSWWTINVGKVSNNHG